MIRWLAAALAALFLAAAPAAAQTVNQSGAVSPGHAGCWVTSGLLKDGGSPSNFQCNGLGLYNGANSPLGISSQTGAGALSGTWGTLTLGSTSTAASLTTLNSAGTAQPLNLAIGGDTTYTIGGTNWLSTIFGQQFCTTTGSVLYRDSGGTWKCLGPGNSGQVLQTQGVGQNPQWAGSGGIGTVTGVTCGTGLTGGTITSSGTCALSVPVSVANGGTANTTLTAHNVMLGEGTSAVAFAAPGVSGTCLTSNGVSADPTFQSCPGTGTVTSLTHGSTAITLSPTTITSSGTIDCTTATASQIGCSKPDGSTITASSGTLSTASTTVLGTTCTPGSSCISVGQVPGTATNDSAGAGNVGQYVSAQVASGSAISIGAGTNITSISLTAGDWDVSANAYFIIPTSTVTTAVSGIVSLTSASTVPVDLMGLCQNDMNNATSPGNVTSTCFVGPTRVSVASTTTVYLNEAQVSSGGTITGYGIIRARRVR